MSRAFVSYDTSHESQPRRAQSSSLSAQWRMEKKVNTIGSSREADRLRVGAPRDSRQAVMKDGKTHSPQPSSATGRIAGMKRAGRAAGGKARGKKIQGNGSSPGYLSWRYAREQWSGVYALTLARYWSMSHCFCSGIVMWLLSRSMASSAWRSGDTSRWESI